MQVTHSQDHITHAVLGGGKQMDMGISDSAEFFHILSSTLYTDQILAVVRETLCNANDAHKDAGRTDQPFHVTVTDEKFIIRDFGYGIPMELMGQIYGVYGASTKKNDGTATGGFGLGCKSPFAYTDHFQVTCFNEGIKTVYSMSKSSAETNGKPTIIPIVSLPTQESGLEVSINLKPGDGYRFRKLAMRIIANGGMNVVLNNEVVPTIPFQRMDKDYLITDKDVLETFSRICVRYGDVIYPADAHDQYRPQYLRAISVIEQLKGRFTLVLQAEPNSISITPSREALSMQDRTVNTLEKMLNKFLRQYDAGFYKACLTEVKAATDEAVKSPTHMRKLMERQDGKSDLFNVHTTDHYIFDLGKSAKNFLTHRYPDDRKFFMNDMGYRLKKLIESGSLDRGLMQKLRKAFLSREDDKYFSGCVDGRDFLKKWWLTNIYAPVAAPMVAAGLEKDRLLAIHQERNYGGHGWGTGIDHVAARHYWCGSMLGYIGFARKIVVITHSKKDIHERISYYEEYSKLAGTNHSFLAYVVPRIPKKVDAAREFFATLKDHMILDLTLKIEKAAPIRAVAVAKKTGFPMLAACTGSNSHNGSKRFCQVTSRSKNTAYVEKPQFTTCLYSRSDKYNDKTRLPNLTEKQSQFLLKHFGDVGAVTVSSVQQETLAKKGIVPAEVFLREKVLHTMLHDKEIKAYLSFSPDAAYDYAGSAGVEEEYVDMFIKSKLLCEKLKIMPVLDQFRMDVLDMWASNSQYTKSTDPVIKAGVEKIESVVAHRVVKSLIDKIAKNYELFQLLEVDSVVEALGSRSEEVRERTATFILKILKS